MTEPFPIQAATIPDALAGKDVLGRGQTGSGKTLAFGLPMLARSPAADADAASRPRRSSWCRPVSWRMQVPTRSSRSAHVLGLRMKLVGGGMSYRQADLRAASAASTSSSPPRAG